MSLRREPQTQSDAEVKDAGSRVAALRRTRNTNNHNYKKLPDAITSRMVRKWL